MRATLETVSCGELTAVYRKDSDTGIVELVLVPTSRTNDIVRDDCAAEPLVQAKIVGDDYPFGFSQGRTMRNAKTVTDNMVYGTPNVIRNPDGSLAVITRIDDKRGWHYECTLTMTPASKAAENSHVHGQRIRSDDHTLIDGQPGADEQGNRRHHTLPADRQRKGAERESHENQHRDHDDFQHDAHRGHRVGTVGEQEQVDYDDADALREVRDRREDADVDGGIETERAESIAVGEPVLAE